MHRHFLSCALLLAAAPALALDGVLDSTFGAFASGRNIVAIDSGGSNSDTLAGTLVAADGSIFLVGTSLGSNNESRISITKLTPDGAVEFGFGTNGTVLSSLSTVTARRARLDADGNILIAGSRSFSGDDRDFLVCRYDQQGQGVPFSALGSFCTTVPFDIAGGNLTDVAEDIIIEPSGRLVLVGSAGVSASRSRAAVARLLPDGLPDTSFSSNGRNSIEPITGKINTFNAIARRADGKYIAVGEAGDAASSNGTDALFARLTVNGSPDPSFQGGNGFALYSPNVGDPFHRDESARVITILGNGDMLMAGNLEISSGSTQTAAFVYKIKPLDVANVDVSFGNTGAALIGGGFSYAFSDMLVQSDDKIILIGTNNPSTDPDRQVHIVRLKPNGQIDTQKFGTMGRANIDFLLPGNRDLGISAAFQNGRIIIGGYSLNTLPANHDLTVTGLFNDLLFADNFD